MIRLQLKSVSPEPVENARSMLQTAIGVELGTLPPYLYALFSIPPGKNLAAAARVRSVAMQEMIHMCLACNILNAIGGSPAITPQLYPGPLPGDIGPPGGEPLTIHLLPFSVEAMEQGMAIEQPVKPIKIPVKARRAEAAPAVTIGQFYEALDELLSDLEPGDWTPGRNQIDDSQFFAGQLFPINSYEDAHKAIDEIVSEGEGAPDNPLDFQDEVAHYYRFGECKNNKVLTKAKNKVGYTYGPDSLGIDWTDVYPAIPDPGKHDFSKAPPAARAAQAACNQAYTQMVDELRRAVNGETGRLGNAVRAMFDLRTSAQVAMTTPLAHKPGDKKRVAGPSFIYTGASK